MRPGLLLAIMAGLWLTARTEPSDPPPLGHVRFEGPTPPKVESLLKRHPPGVGEPFDPARAGALSDAVLEAWRLEGYPLAKVSWSAGPAEGVSGLELVYVSEPGLRGRLEELGFEGNQALPDEVLREGLRLVPRPGPWNRFTGRDLLFLEHLGADAAALLDQYHRRGFMAAEVGQPVVEYASELEGYRIRWPIAEGEPYRLGEVAVTPGTPDLVARLARETGVVSGNRFLPGVVTRLRELTLEQLRGEGYAFAEFEAEPTWRDAEAEVDLRLSATPGPRVRLDGVEVSGNTATDGRVIRRELPLRPGDLFHPAGLRAFESRLVDLGLFRSVDVEYRQSAPDAFDVEVAVEEAETGRVETGVSYGSEEGPAFLIQARETNFSLRPPFRGDALRLEAAATAGPDIVRATLGLENPRVGESLWGLGGRVFYEDNRYLSDLYDQQSHGLGLLAAYPLTPWLRVFTGPQWTFYRLENLREDVEEELVEETEVDLSGWRAGWVWNRTDRAFRPRRGARFEQEVLYGTEWLGGDTEVLELSARGAVYLNPVGEQVLLFRAGVHSIEAQGETERVPVALRSYLGGVGNLRGFEYRTVSTLDADGDPVGGQSAWWASAEYLLPVLPRLDLSLYVDAGDVGEDAYAFSGEGPVWNWGVGLVIRAENFPVRLDVAVPGETLEGDRVNETGEPHLSFSAGYLF